ncbi:hypothetical protein [Bacillus smithii]|uniref:hypothetical protein n=1 Tax=Bacillus smithii TaxID=1479 RepID=UPI003D20880C
MVRKIEIKKAYEEVEIGNKIYRVDLGDDKVKEYQDFFNEYQKEAEKLEKTDVTKLSPLEQDEYRKRSKELTKHTFDVILGEGAFEEIYELTGRSSIVMFDIISQVMDIINERSNEFKEKAKEYYTKKK